MFGGAGAVLSGRDRAVVLFGVVLLGLLGAAVLATSGPGPATGARSSPDAATLVEGVVGRATSINPLEPRNAADLDLIALVFSGLTRSFSDGSVGPDLAEGWTISRDGTVYTFTLRAGLTWQDGVPLTADDVVFTVLTIQNPDYQGPLRASWRSVQVEKLDSRTVRFTLAEPVGAFLQATTLPLLPAHLLVDVPISDLVDAPFNRQPVGSGPYRVVRLDFDEAELRLEEGYWAAGRATAERAGSGGPIERIVVRFFPTGSDLVQAYRARFVDTAAGLLPDQAGSIATSSDTTVQRYPTTRLTALVPNVRPGHQLFTAVEVRRGLLRALDRDGMIAGLLDGAAVRADSPIAPASWAYDRESTTVYEYDRSVAAEDLEAAGWKRDEAAWVTKAGDPVAISLATVDAAGDPLGDTLARTIAAQWTTLGVGTTVVEYGADGFVAQLVRGNFDMALLNVTMGLDPDVFPLLTSSQALEGGSNVGGYQSASLDKLLARARLGVDREARVAAFAELQAALTRDLPMLPIAFFDELYVVRSRLDGPSERLIANRSGRFWDVLTWRLAGGPATEAP